MPGGSTVLIGRMMKAPTALQRPRSVLQVAGGAAVRALAPACAAGGRLFAVRPSIRRTIQQWVDADWFGAVSVGLILLNVALMMCEQYPMDPALALLLEDSNIGITLVFAAEMMLKHLAHGGVAYWAEPFNRFDGVIVLTSLLDVASAYVSVGIHGQVLRAFRLLRVFKLLRSWSSLQRVLNALLSTLQSLFYLMLLLALLLFIFALLGRQLFGGQ